MPTEIELDLKRAGDFTLIAKANSGHWTIMDIPEKSGGNDGAMAPFEHFFAALAGCTGTDVLYVLKKKRLRVDDFSIKLNANRRDEFPQIATDIHIHFTIVGKDIPDEAVARAIELSREKYCSVTAMIRPDVPITTSFEVVSLAG